MAVLSSDKQYVTVQKGDTLWDIADEYLGDPLKYKQLAAINNIKNPDLIYIGQKIQLYSSGSSSSGTSTSNTNVVTNIKFGLLANVDDTLFATWDWSKSKETESYKVSWTYDTGSGIWLDGRTQNITVDKDQPSLSQQDTYSIPASARKVRFRVKPISKTKGDDNKTTYWDADWCAYQTWTDSTPLATPSAPSIDIEQYTLTSELNNLDNHITHVEFQVVKNDEKAVKTSKAKVNTSAVSFSCTVDAGARYKVRCRVINGSDYSDWSQYSENKNTIPATPGSITTCRANSKTEVYLEWEAAGAATSYNIEYATDKNYFDITDQTTTTPDIETTKYSLIGLETGHEYFFRVRANNSAGNSPWSGIVSTLLGSTPAAPTTWSSTTTVTTGEPLILYWVHNSKDGSSQKYAELEIYVDGVLETHEITNTTDEEERDKTSSCSINTSTYIQGTTIEWRVRTAGVTNEYGEWSVQRTINVYAPPTLELELTDIDGSNINVLTGFPVYVSALAGPNTQAPIGYYLTVTSNDIYETVDSVGNPKIINAGDALYSKYFDISNRLVVELSAGNIDLENNMRYTVTCTVSMNSGLTATESLEFTVDWTDVHYEPNAEIGIDPDTYTAYIRPYCEQGTLTNYRVNYSNGTYTVTSQQLGGVYGEPIPGAFIATGEQVYEGVDEDGTDLYFCTIETRSIVDGLWLAVYRREFDGSFMEIATGIDNDKNTTVTDPHPSLDYARYRIVATSKSTGAVSYADLPGAPMNAHAVIIQWDEQWSNFEAAEDMPEQPPWSGSLLKLPYNIDVSESNNSDVSLVKYIGRTQSVAYYGTHIGDTATWNMDIVKSDVETLYALRRLKRWMGNVYVREPSGTGYWASISVTFNQKHLEMTIPVTLNITRVEGGI